MSEPQVTALPRKRTQKVNWSAVTTMARANPGEWVLVPVDLNKAVASQIRMRKYPAIDPTEFEVATRQIENQPKGRVNIWVRTR